MLMHLTLILLEVKWKDFLCLSGWLRYGFGRFHCPLFRHGFRSPHRIRLLELLGHLGEEAEEKGRREEEPGQTVDGEQSPSHHWRGFDQWSPAGLGRDGRGWGSCTRSGHKDPSNFLDVFFTVF